MARTWRQVGVWFGIAMVMLAAFAGSATAATGMEMELLPKRDSLTGEESPLSRGGQWAATAWATASPPAGETSNANWISVGGEAKEIWSAGWHPATETGIAAAYYKTSVSQPAGASVQISHLPAAAGQYQSLLLDMSSSGINQNGYEVRWTYKTATTDTLTLFRWTEGIATAMFSTTVALQKGWTVGLSDEGSSVKLWLFESTLERPEVPVTPIITLSDSTFSGGYAGVEATGYYGRLDEFKLGTLAKASRAEEVAGLPLRDSLKRTETTLSNGGKWSALHWSTDTPATGTDTTTGWTVNQTYPAVAGAYYTTAYGEPSAASVTLATATGNEGRHQALWLDMPEPGSAQSGYELSWTYSPWSNLYEVELAEWSGGTKTELAWQYVEILESTTLAISDEGGTVRAWLGSEGEFSSILSAESSTYSSGYAGIEASGNLGRLTEFKAGPLVESGPGEEVAALPLRDPLNRSENPLSNSGRWAPQFWSEGSPTAGIDTPNGWRSNIGYPGGAGVYWTSPFSQPDAASVTMTVSPGSENRYQTLWLDQQEPGAKYDGYMLAWVYFPAKYVVALYKWVAGKSTELGSTVVAVPSGSTLAISDEGSTVRAWLGSGGSFSSILSAKDSTYSSGYAGIGAFGTNGRLTEFKAGSLAKKSRAEEVAETTLRDPLNRSENPLSNGGQWSALKWSADTPPTGIDAGSGWCPSRVYPTLSGAFWNTSFKQPSAASVTMPFSTGIEGRHQDVWIDMPEPGAAKSGYQLSWIYKTSTSYLVTLSKWVGGTQTELDSTTIPISVGSTLAISDEGATVRAWLGSAGSLTPILSAEDSTYSSGYAGIEASGTNGRLAEFRAGN